MAKFTATYDFLHHPDLIYVILSDVERMSEFMPLCKRSQILSRRATDDAEVVDANFLLRYREIGFEREFDLELTLRPVERRIDIAQIETAVGSGSARCRRQRSRCWPRSSRPAPITRTGLPIRPTVSAVPSSARASSRS